MTSKFGARLLKIEKLFAELENHPVKPLVISIYSSEKSTTSLRYIKKILLNFYEIGIFWEVEKETQSITTNSKVFEYLIKHVNWLAHYIGVYSRREIDFADLSSKEVVYRIRSGIEFLLTNFQQISPELDQTLEDLREFSSVEDEFDSILTLWIESGLHYPLKEGDIPKNLPKTHWWWFKALQN